ncbi:hypothetical protein [Streptomyces griseorubiginosus]|uniref:Uncharacterized protein n=1 Tax=Streptomyces griseorubiginosus TaxID=67304 RepID=A0AAI8PQK9_9ACTN|nr:hypothetical protein [Streptomyces griseorubiginosus]AYC41241.1 hypothetical protein DWG14_05523 [Streptomyces griseorubiginosus]
MVSVKNAADFLNPESPLLALEEEVKALGAGYKWSQLYEDSAYLLVEIKCGRKSRYITISENDATDYLGFNFTKFRGLGEYEAYETLTEEPYIEVAVTGNGGPWLRMLDRIPGWSPEDPSSRINRSSRGTVKIRGDRGEDWSAELGTPSDDFRLLSRYGASTLRLFGKKNQTHDEALKFLEAAGNAILFDIDLKYGISLTMRRVRSLNGLRIARRARVDTPPALPKLQYATEPLSLYTYARSAQGMPLLEFLAYYQVLEYYFPRYSQRDQLDKLRNELRDPTFRTDDDRDLSRILRISQQSGRGYGDERSQLKSTVRYCAPEDAISGFFDSNLEIGEHFADKKQSIAGLTPLDLSGKKTDLINAVCERIYDIRCRVVHSKEDGGGQAESLLMPFSPEAESLRAENILMRFLAQKVLIAGASDMPV